jgi:hypothetical protein
MTEVLPYWLGFGTAVGLIAEIQNRTHYHVQELAVR